jgi:T5orf172 domain
MHTDDTDRNAFMLGYQAALRDIEGRHTGTRNRLLNADPAKSTAAAYDARGEDWMTPIADYHELQAQRALEARPPQRSRGTGTIYALGNNNGQVKIGWTGRPLGERVRDLSLASGVHLEVLGTIPGTQDDEAAIHQRFAAARGHGEWFKRTPEINAWIETL